MPKECDIFYFDQQKVSFALKKKKKQQPQTYTNQIWCKLAVSPLYSKSLYGSKRLFFRSFFFSLVCFFPSKTFGCAERVNILIPRLSARKETSVARRRNLTVFSVHNSQMPPSAEGKRLQAQGYCKTWEFLKDLSEKKC